jgi:diadenosine tetraphosphatase ApaH/serine/threonine PP2A family protein phosphatase
MDGDAVNGLTRDDIHFIWMASFCWLNGFPMRKDRSPDDVEADKEKLRRFAAVFDITTDPGWKDPQDV